MAEWNEYTVADVISTVIDYRGKTPKKLGGDWSDHGYRALSAKNVKTGKIVNPDSIRYVSQELYNNWMKEEIEKEDILITSEAPFGQIYYWDSDEKIVLSQRLFAVRIRKEFYPKYIYFYMTSSAFQAELNSRATGTTVTGLRQPELLRCKILAPDYNEQKRIADILWSMEKKIDLNEEINNNLLEQAVALYNKMCPFSIDSDLPQDWRVGTVGEIVDIHDSKRIPLSGKERDQMENKIYPYYGAASLMDFVDNYIFDGKYLLLGEDGTVVDDKGYPILQYVWGKFWVNNHAHILTGSNGFNVESLYVLFKQTSVASIVTGAVQPKISQANLRSIKVVIPPKPIIESYNDQVEPIFSLIRTNEDFNSSLIQVRDALLPKLMSGELDVSTVEI